MKCEYCGAQSELNSDFTYFPKEPEHPLCGTCTDAKFWWINNIVSSGDKDNE